MIDHLSYSSISHYMNCSRSWRYHYVNQLESDKSEALLFGSAWHKMISLVAGDGEPVSMWSDVVRDMEIHDDDLIENVMDTGYRLLKVDSIKTHLQGLKPAYRDINIGEYRACLDHKFEFTIPSVEVPIIGYIDMIDQDMVPIDFKTASRKWTQERADSDLQATFYIAGMHSQGLIKSNQFPYPFEFHVFTKTKNPEVQVLRTYRTAKQVLDLFDLIKDVWKAIKAEAYIPNPGSWKCSDKYCPFWQHCEGGQKDDYES